MSTLSSRQVAQMLGITHAALSKYIKAGKIPAPKTVTSGRMTLHLWSEKEVELIRQLLPKIANGRKTRYQKQRQRKTTQKKPKR
jgi:predicted transcriptional regulator